jgi:ligand-binding SRPBCC domain-containing protein
LRRAQHRSRAVARATRLAWFPMPRIELATQIGASIAVVFDLSRDIDAHQQTQAVHREKAVAGKTSGLIEMGEEVTWEATHFGIRQRLTSRIVAMERPRYFRDSMIAGPFKCLDHDHFFQELSVGRTVMKDVFMYASPFGPIGRTADLLFLKRYMRRLLVERNVGLKRLAEGITNRSP